MWCLELYGYCINENSDENDTITVKPFDFWRLQCDVCLFIDKYFKWKQFKKVSNFLNKLELMNR